VCPDAYSFGMPPFQKGQSTLLTYRSIR
jgi:hypothetical protein